MADKKKDTLAMLAMGAPEDEDDEAPMDDDDMGGEGMEQAMSDFLDAVKADDPAGMAAAFNDAVAMAQ